MTLRSLLVLSSICGLVLARCGGMNLADSGSEAGDAVTHHEASVDAEDGWIDGALGETSPPDSAASDGSIDVSDTPDGEVDACGDRLCTGAESCSSCPADCGPCMPACTVTYHFSSTAGDDANTETQAQDPSTPWRSLNKLNAIFPSLHGGACLLLRRGDSFTGSIVVGASGTASAPITVGAYGTGERPVVSGFTRVSNWLDVGGHIWQSAAAISTLPTLNLVVVDGVNTGMGREPDVGGGPHGDGFFALQSSTGTTSITSADVTGTPNWTGATLVIRSIRWALQQQHVSAQSGHVITYMSPDPTPTPPTAGYGFFLQNDLRTLTTQNEWYYDASTHRLNVYSATMPTDVRATTTERLASNDGGFDYVCNSAMQVVARELAHDPARDHGGAVAILYPRTHGATEGIRVGHHARRRRERTRSRLPRSLPREAARAGRDAAARRGAHAARNPSGRRDRALA